MSLNYINTTQNQNLVKSGDLWRFDFFHSGEKITFCYQFDYNSATTIELTDVTKFFLGSLGYSGQISTIFSGKFQSSEYTEI